MHDLTLLTIMVVISPDYCDSLGFVAKAVQMA